MTGSAHTNSYNKVLPIWGMWYSQQAQQKPHAQVKEAFNCKILLKLLPTAISS